MSPIATAPQSILPGGCVILPPVGPRPFDPTNPSGCWDPREWSKPSTKPAATMPEHNCWDPRTWGTDIQLPSPDSEIQSVEGAKLLG